MHSARVVAARLSSGGPCLADATAEAVDAQRVHESGAVAAAAAWNSASVPNGLVWLTGAQAAQCKPLIVKDPNHNQIRGTCPEHVLFSAFACLGSVCGSSVSKLGRRSGDGELNLGELDTEVRLRWRTARLGDTPLHVGLLPASGTLLTATRSRDGAHWLRLVHCTSLQQVSWRKIIAPPEPLHSSLHRCLEPLQFSSYRCSEPHKSTSLPAIVRRTSIILYPAQHKQ